MRRLLVALEFLTILPVKTQPKADELAGSMAFFPLVGLFMGAILILVNEGANQLFPLSPLTTNLLIIVTLTILTGALHLDGLADTLDGLYAGKNKEEVLDIMRDPRVGVIGVTGIVLVLMTKWVVLCEMPQAIKNHALLLAPTLGRWSMVLAAFLAPYARKDNGLGQFFAAKINLPVLLTSSLFVLIPFIILLGISGVIPFLSVLLMVIVFVKFMDKKIGGMTGDTLGFVCEFTEILSLFILLVGHQLQWPEE